MTLDEEITSVESLVQVARGAATEHLERATKNLRLGSKALAYYEDFLSATLLNATSLLTLCREIVSLSGTAAEASASITEGILSGVRESMRLMYLAMAILDQLAAPEGHADVQQGEPTRATESRTLRACSFCGKTEEESKLVAGPGSNICENCSRLACGVLGIALSDDKSK